MFRIKNFLSIVAGAINHMRRTQTQITDFNVGGVARTLIEAPAIELDELYIQMANGLLESIPVATYQAFNFDRLPATYAVGEVEFSTEVANEIDFTIPLGTEVKVPGTDKLYATTEEVVLSAGELTVTAAIQAAAVGVAGNTLSETITEMLVPVSGIDAVTNPEALISGHDEESDEGRKIRFAQFINTLSRGTPDAVRFAAAQAVVGQTERINRVGLLEDPPGRVRVFIHNGQDGASLALLDGAQSIVDGYRDGQGIAVPGYRAAGVRAVVLPMTEVVIDLVGAAVLLPGYALDAAMLSRIEQALIDYLSLLAVEENLYVSALLAALVAVEGVAGINLSTPSEDLTGAQDTVFVPGAISLS